jgi:hypothetical protein
VSNCNSSEWGRAELLTYQSVPRLRVIFQTSYFRRRAFARIAELNYREEKLLCQAVQKGQLSLAGWRCQLGWREHFRERR